MVKMHMVYEGNLRCRLTHGPSGSVILTDAPVDNMGKGQAFSPTDLFAASLGSCMLTVMGIFAQKNHIIMAGTTLDVEKEMVVSPVRRIGKVILVFKMAPGIDQGQRAALEQAGLNCPVRKSLGAEVETPSRFEYPD